ncbi:MAG: hypothetical protein PVI40_02305 [Chlamydiota bacterium]|jgi:hypothetical protein
MTSYDLFPGEPIIYSIKSIDGSFFWSKKYIEDPLECVLPSNKKLSFELGDARGFFYMVKLENFIPNEVVRVISNSENETIKSFFILNEEGNGYGSSMPGVIGKEGGIAVFQVITSDNECLECKLPWGNKLTHKKKKITLQN